MIAVRLFQNSIVFTRVLETNARGIFRGLFRTHSNIYMVLRKWLAAESRYLFSQKRSIVNIRLDSKHIPAIC